MSDNNKAFNMIGRMKNAGDVELNPTQKVEIVNMGAPEAVLISPENEQLTKEEFAQYNHNEILNFTKKNEELINAVDVAGLEKEKVDEIKLSIQEQLDNVVKNATAFAEQKIKEATQAETPVVATQAPEAVAPEPTQAETPIAQVETPIAVTQTPAVEEYYTEPAQVQTENLNQSIAGEAYYEENQSANAKPKQEVDFDGKVVEKKSFFKRQRENFSKFMNNHFDMASMGFDGTPIGGLAVEQFDVVQMVTGKSTKQLILETAKKIKDHVEEQNRLDAEMEALARKREKEKIDAVKNAVKGLFSGLFKIAKDSYEAFVLAENAERAKLEQGKNLLKIEKYSKSEKATIEKMRKLEAKARALRILQIRIAKSTTKTPMAQPAVENVSTEPAQNTNEDYYTEPAQVQTETAPVVIQTQAEVVPLEAPVMVTQIETAPDVISDQVFYDFVDNKGVPENILNDIALKIKEGKPVSIRERAIKDDKIQGEKINQKLAITLRVEALAKEISEMEAKLPFNPQLKSQIEEAKRDLDSMKEKAGLNSAPIAQQVEAQPDVVNETTTETVNEVAVEKPVAELTDAERIAKFTQIENERSQKEQEVYNKRSQEIIAQQNARREQELGTSTPVVSNQTETTAQANPRLEEFANEAQFGGYDADAFQKMMNQAQVAQESTNTNS
ncbi:MAG: hypothetical protein WCO65_02170 [bacterium]